MSAIRTILISALCAVLGAGVVALATQTNYLGTVFIADTTTPTNQLKVNSDGSINAVVSGGGGSGTVTSIATGCQATGGTITTSGTISTQNQWFALSTNAIVAGDCGGTVSVGSSSDTAPTIAVSGSAGFPQWWYTYLCSAGTHSQTITPASGTIGGASTYVLAAGTAAAPSCVKITSDAANTDYKVSFVPGSVTASSTTTFTNKTITSSTDTLGGVTAGFGSDAKGDIYTNGGSSNVITRLGIGSTGNCLVVASALPSWASCLTAAPLATGSSTGNTLTAPIGYFICTSTCTVTPPVPAAGVRFCVMNADNASTVITLGAIGSSARYENTARTAYGTAGTGTLTSGGAVGDLICILGLDATHYLSPTFVGTWVAS